MSTDKTWQTVSTSSEATEKLGEALGARLRGGEVLELRSDLGGGKTTFVRGLARGMGSTDKVASPTFTIVREYNAHDRTLYHFDFYRLNDPGLVANELAEVIHDPQAVVVVEWADIVEDVLPADAISITIKNIGETSRDILVSVPESRSYIQGNS